MIPMTRNRARIAKRRRSMRFRLAKRGRDSWFERSAGPACINRLAKETERSGTGGETVGEGFAGFGFESELMGYETTERRRG
jgi:hypothetical protein